MKRNPYRRVSELEDDLRDIRDYICDIVGTPEDDDEGEDDEEEDNPQPRRPRR